MTALLHGLLFWTYFNWLFFFPDFFQLLQPLLHASLLLAGLSKSYHGSHRRFVPLLHNEKYKCLSNIWFFFTKAYLKTGQHAILTILELYHVRYSMRIWRELNIWTRAILWELLLDTTNLEKKITNNGINNFYHMPDSCPVSTSILEKFNSETNWLYKAIFVCWYLVFITSKVKLISIFIVMVTRGKIIVSIRRRQTTDLVIYLLLNH